MTALPHAPNVGYPLPDMAEETGGRLCHMSNDLHVVRVIKCTPVVNQHVVHGSKMLALVIERSTSERIV